MKISLYESRAKEPPRRIRDAMAETPALMTTQIPSNITLDYRTKDCFQTVASMLDLKKKERVDHIGIDLARS